MTKHTKVSVTVEPGRRGPTASDNSVVSVTMHIGKEYTSAVFDLVRKCVREIVALDTGACGNLTVETVERRVGWDDDEEAR